MPEEQDFEAQFEALAEQHQATAAVVLEGAGLLDISRLIRVAHMQYSFAEYDRWNGGTYIFDVHLRVDAHLLGDFSDDVCAQVKDTLERVAADIPNVWIGKIVPVPKPVNETISVNNQALDITQKWNGPTRHNLRFRSTAEAAMFDSLERKQRELPRGDTILIVPLPAVWTGRYRREPDFLIAYKGRIGAIEIDDPSHSHRYAADKSRDQLLEDQGIQLTRRVHVEDTATERERSEFIEVFLQRLARGL